MTDIIGSLAAQFGLQPDKVESAAGSVFKLVQQQAGGGDFQQLLGALPQIQQWIGKAGSAAPAAGGGGGLLGGIGALAGSLGGGGGAALGPLLAELAGSGLKPETLTKLIPALLTQVQKHVDPAVLEKVLASVPALKALASGGSGGGLAGALGGLLSGR